MVNLESMSPADRKYYGRLVQQRDRMIADSEASRERRHRLSDGDIEWEIGATHHVGNMLASIRDTIRTLEENHPSENESAQSPEPSL